MSKKIIVDGNFPEDIRVAVLNSKNLIEDLSYQTANKTQNKGSIYLAKIIRIEPSLQAAFIEYGSDKHGFLPFSEIHHCYHHIPTSDQQQSNPLEEIKPLEIAEEKLQNNENNTPIDHANNITLDASEEDIEHINIEKYNAINQQKSYAIQEVMKKGQVLLVQVTKEERGNKGAAFTTYITLAGKYCILIPNRSMHNGVSRKISSANERKRLKNIIEQLITGHTKSMVSLVARTAAIGHSMLAIKKDYDYLIWLWNKIRETTLNSIAPCFIHAENNIIHKTIRDLFDNNVKEVMVQGREAYHAAVSFMQGILADKVNKIKEYKQKTPIFTKYNIEEQVANLYHPIVTLPSGGYVVINPTEALIAIDVNSGKAITERNIEETAVNTNVEAAKAIAHQMKLRDLSGLIVIDFIDMNESKNRKIIERTLKEHLSSDRARIQLSQISTFGLLEMSRQRLRPSFLEFNTSICYHCSGKGVVRANESNAILILRTIENEIFNENNKLTAINIYAHASVIVFLLNSKRQEVSYIETKYNIKLNFHIDPTSSFDSYSIEKVINSKGATGYATTTKEQPAINIDNQNTNTNKEEKIHNKPKSMDEPLDIESKDEVKNVDNQNTLNAKAKKTLKKSTTKKYIKKP